MHIAGIRSLAIAVAIAAAAAGCAGGQPSEGVAVPAVGALDGGAAARAAVLARYADATTPMALDTPSIVGRTVAAAEALLSEEGLSMHLVTFDRQQPGVTAQYPAAGQPVPLDGVIEAWLGEPPTEAPEAVVEPPAAETSPEPSSTSTPVPAPAEAEPSSAVAAADQVEVQFILPPHTDGMLRINPRQLPAVPLGTELTGVASWYGPGFHGRTTACGGVFDQNGATLATRELRCGTVVRITGPSGRTVEATVTDWGPAEWTGRRFDLSAAVFNAIAPIGAGVVPVRIITANVPS